MSTLTTMSRDDATPRGPADPPPLPGFATMFRQLIRAPGRSRTALTVELFGWLILLEAPIMILAPQFAASLLRLPALDAPAVNYFRLAGLLVGGLGLLYIASGRLNSREFAFASLLDRPLVPFVMLAFWWLGVIPGSLALIFTLQDGISFIWTLLTWRAERSAAAPPTPPRP